MSDTMKRMWTERQVRALGVDAVEQKSDLKVFENIVDKDGHKRFIEGDFELKEETGLTYTYAKWSLSGSHLMIVFAGSIENSATLSGTTITEITLPQWIIDKVTPIYSTNITLSSIDAYGDDASKQTISCTLYKEANKLKVYRGGITATRARYFRQQFDLLIDDE